MFKKQKSSQKFVNTVIDTLIGAKPKKSHKKTKIALAITAVSAIGAVVLNEALKPEDSQ